jgi:hypothetical protein
MIGPTQMDSNVNGVQEHPYVLDQQNEWLQTQFHSPDWTHFITLTTTQSTTPQSLEKSFLWWIRRLENLNQKRVNYLYSIEKSSPSHLHIHCVLGNVSGLSINQIKNLWSHIGFSRISLFDHDLQSGGIRYVMKDVLDGTSLGFGEKLKGMTNHHSHRRENQRNQTQENHP